jgi:Holliday junction DNA helicase RuvA
MISYIEGKILNKFEKSAIIENNGIGYEIFLSTSSLDKATNGSKISLYTRAYLREEQIVMYGFQSIEELGFFKVLLSVPGVGPKTAMELMGVELNKLKGAILHSDLAMLTKIPGIGKKTAERIILELKGKLEILAPGTPYSKENESEIEDEIIEAITRLGYQRTHVNKVLKNIPKNIKNAEEIIKYFLQNV